MALLNLIPALALAFLALSGWPAEWAVWLRSLIALASLSASLIAMTWLTPSSHTPRFKNARRPSVPDRIAGGTAIILSLVALYCILVTGPSATGQLTQALMESTDSNLDVTEDWSDSVSDQSGALGDDAAQAEVGMAFDPNGATVPNSADLAPSDKLEAILELATIEDARRLHRSGSIYITSFSHSFFDGHRWTSSSSMRPRIITSNAEGLIRLPESNSNLPTYHYTIFHGRFDDRPNTVKALQGPNYIRLPEVTRIASGVHLLPSLEQSASSYQYEAGSSPQRFEGIDRLIEPGSTEPVYSATTTNAGLRSQIQSLSAGFNRDLPMQQRLAELQHWLRNTYSYSLVVNYPNNGKCALENFLGDGNPDGNTNAGFCVHFASAATLLARELGVPSRICYGWTGGQFYEQHKQFVFRSEHAHAWTEIFLKDHGWTIFDATPISALPQSGATLPGEAPPALDEEAERFGVGDESTLPFNKWWLLIIFGSGLLMLAAILTFKLRRTSQSLRQRLPVGSSPPAGYLKLFLQTCMRFGHPLPPGRTLFQHLEFLRGEEIFIYFADDLLTYHYDITYRNFPRNSQTEKRLRTQIKSWTLNS